MPERPIMYYIFEKQAFQRISNMILRGHKKVKVDEDGRRWMQVGTGYECLSVVEHIFGARSISDAMFLSFSLYYS